MCKPVGNNAYKGVANMWGEGETWGGNIFFKGEDWIVHGFKTMSYSIFYLKKFCFLTSFPHENISLASFPPRCLAALFRGHHLPLVPCSTLFLPLHLYESSCVAHSSILRWRQQISLKCQCLSSGHNPEESNLHVHCPKPHKFYCIW
jgi:hypothetical protein